MWLFLTVPWVCLQCVNVFFFPITLTFFIVKMLAGTAVWILIFSKLYSACSFVVARTFLNRTDYLSALVLSEQTYFHTCLHTRTLENPKSSVNRDVLI